MYYIGVDVGGMSLKAGLVDMNGNIIHKDSTPTNSKEGYKKVIKDMAGLVLKVMEDAGVKLENVKSIGVGIPGAPDNQEGIAVIAVNIGFKNVPLRKELQKFINLPVYIDNDANCAALAESIAGAAKGADCSITVTLGTGIGSGVIINKRIFSGFNSGASEMGHTVIMVDGEQCNCGRKGCWETYASASAVIRQTRKAAEENPDSLINKLVDGDLSKIDAKTAFDAAKQGDATAKSVVDRYIYYIAEGLINIINTFQPEILVIGGGVSREGEYLLKPLRKHIADRAFGSGILPVTEIKAAEMGNDAGIIGAAMLGA
jgi:glucokinase